MNYFIRNIDLIRNIDKISFQSVINGERGVNMSQGSARECATALKI